MKKIGLAIDTVHIDSPQGGVKVKIRLRETQGTPVYAAVFESPAKDIEAATRHELITKCENHLDRLAKMTYEEFLIVHAGYGGGSLEYKIAQIGTCPDGKEVHRFKDRSDTDWNTYWKEGVPKQHTISSEKLWKMVPYSEQIKHRIELIQRAHADFQKRLADQFTNENIDAILAGDRANFTFQLVSGPPVETETRS